MQRSGTYSDVSSVAEAFPTVTTHDEQSQVFAVMDEVVSKSVVSKGLINFFVQGVYTAHLILIK